MGRRRIYDITNIRQAQQNQTTNTPIIKRRGSTFFLEFLTKFFYGIFYLSIIALTSIGATTLLNSQLRDILFEIIRNTFF